MECNIIFAFFSLIFEVNILGSLIINDKFITIPNCKNYVINAVGTYKVITTRRLLGCADECLRAGTCISFNYLKSTFQCHLNNGVIDGTCSNAIYTVSSRYFEKQNPPYCLNGGQRVPAVTGSCSCINSYVGARCERLMYDCVDGVPYYHTMNGIYNILPPGAVDPFQVKCVMNWGGRTMVAEHVGIPYIFNRTWQEAKNGHSDPQSANYWIGLNELYLITSQQSRSLCLQIQDQSNAFQSNCFKNFHIGNENQKFKILGLQTNYIVFGNCMPFLIGASFSTFDDDNDNTVTRNCASEYGAHWWYNANCAKCNPLGALTNPKGQTWNGATELVHWQGLSYTPPMIKLYLEP